MGGIKVMMALTSWLIVNAEGKVAMKVLWAGHALSRCSLSSVEWYSRKVLAISKGTGTS